MTQLIKKGGLRERANRSRQYQGSENTETSLKPNSYQRTPQKDLSPPFTLKEDIQISPSPDTK